MAPAPIVNADSILALRPDDVVVTGSIGPSSTTARVGDSIGSVGTTEPVVVVPGSVVVPPSEGGDGVTRFLQWLQGYVPL